MGWFWNVVSVAVCTASVAALGCGDSSSSETTEAAEAPIDNMGTSGDDPADPGSTSDEATSGMTEDSGPSEPSVTTSGADADPSSGSSGGAPGADASTGTMGETEAAGQCEPTGDACADCMAANCCAEIEECLTDAVCSCFQQCAAENPDDALGCADPDQCNIPLFDLLDPNTVVGRMSTCTQTSCAKCI